MNNTTDASFLDKCEKVGSNPTTYERKTAHYVVRASEDYIQKGFNWAEHIEDTVYPTMINMMGHEPKRNMHALHFVPDKLCGCIRAWWKPCCKPNSKEPIGSHIYIWQRKMSGMPPYQPWGGITWETIHGLLYEVKSEKADWEPLDPSPPNGKGELLDYVFEMELCQQLGIKECCSQLQQECDRLGGNYSAFLEFWKEYGWRPFQLLIGYLHNLRNSRPTLDKDNLVYYMSSFVKEDVSPFFEKCDWQIIDETKQKIRKVLNG
jgi:hypothetical protein